MVVQSKWVSSKPSEGDGIGGAGGMDVNCSAASAIIAAIDKTDDCLRAIRSRRFLDATAAMVSGTCKSGGLCFCTCGINRIFLLRITENPSLSRPLRYSINMYRPVRNTVGARTLTISTFCASTRPVLHRRRGGVSCCAVIGGIEIMTSAQKRLWPDMHGFPAARRLRMHQATPFLMTPAVPEVMETVRKQAAHMHMYRQITMPINRRR
jgi:hypothetical protein